MTKELETVKNVIMETKQCYECNMTFILRLESNMCSNCQSKDNYTVLEKPCRNCKKVSTFL